MTKITLRVEDLITLSAAAKILGVSRPTVYNLMDRYRLHPLVIGRNRYLLREEVEFLRESQQKQDPPGLLVGPKEMTTGDGGHHDTV